MVGESISTSSGILFGISEDLEDTVADHTGGFFEDLQVARLHSSSGLQYSRALKNDIL